MSDMNEQQTSFAIGKIERLRESTRDTVAAAIWLVVFVSLLVMTLRGQSILMTAGLLLQLTAAYSTFLVCGKLKSLPLAQIMPYAFSLAGAALLCLAPDFPAPVAASAVFLAVTAVMHGSAVNDMRKTFADEERTAFVSECLT